MKVTPLDIRRKEFKRGMRGYADEEVDVFLDDVADEFERLFQENIELQDRIARQDEQIASHAQLKGALEKALVSAQLQADQMIANARKESELILKDAELKSRQIVNDSYVETQRVQQALVQLKQLEEDFRFKFRSLLEGHLKLLGEATIVPAAAAADVTGEAPAREVAGVSPGAEAPVLDDQDRLLEETVALVGLPDDTSSVEEAPTPAIESEWVAAVAPSERDMLPLESSRDEAVMASIEEEETPTEETETGEVERPDIPLERTMDTAAEEAPAPALPVDDQFSTTSEVFAAADLLANESTAEVEAEEAPAEPDEEPEPESRGYHFGRRLESDELGLFGQRPRPRRRAATSSGELTTETELGFPRDRLYCVLKRSCSWGCVSAPRRGRPRCEGLYGDRIKVSLSAPPEDNRANAELVRVLASWLGLRGDSVRLRSGHGESGQGRRVRRYR